jgi:hypothetical protein
MKLWRLVERMKGERHKMKKVLAVGIAVTLMFILMPSAVVANTYEVSVSPIVEANVVGEEHTVTVTIDPALGSGDSAAVNFSVEYGPNTGEGVIVNLGEGDSEASFTYQSNGMDGLDEITIEVEINGAPYDIPVEVNEVVYDSNQVYKIWLTDKFSGGGKIIQEDEGTKKKDWNKISWGGWAGGVEGYFIGQFEVTFHNVGTDFDWLDKAKFVSQDELLGITELNWLWYGDQSSCPDACPPESEANFVWLNVDGYLLDEDGEEIPGDWMLGIRASDNGEPGNIDEYGGVASDSIVFALWDDGSLEYESFLAGDFAADQYPCFSIRHELDGGNLQIVVPPAID